MPHRTDSCCDVHYDKGCEEWDRLRRWRDKKGMEREKERKSKEREKEVMEGTHWGGQFIWPNHAFAYIMMK
jgi:hypothetical protein